jgi:hypothetical protein
MFMTYYFDFLYRRLWSDGDLNVMSNLGMNYDDIRFGVYDDSPLSPNCSDLEYFEYNTSGHHTRLERWSSRKKRAPKKRGEK